MPALSLLTPLTTVSMNGGLDPIAELKLRRWAREHHVPAAERDPLWHPVVWQEMAARDRERAARTPDRSVPRSVPLRRAA